MQDPHTNPSEADLDRHGSSEINAISVFNNTDAFFGLVLDGEASDAEWRAFSAGADASPELWKRLAQHARLHAMLGKAMGELDDSIVVTLPSTEQLSAQPTTDSGPNSFAAGVARVVRGGGWIAAAGVALAWAVIHLAFSSQHNDFSHVASGDGNGNGIAAPQLRTVNGVIVNTADEALDAYRTLARQSGVDVDEAPEQIVIEVLPALDGRSVEVVAVRQLIERRILDGLYRVALDDAGAPALLPLHVSFGFERTDEPPTATEDANSDI